MMNVESVHKGHHHRFMRSVSFQELMHMAHHHSHDHKSEKATSRTLSVPRKGWVVVKVGKEEDEEEMKRFVVPVSYLNHPSFAELLDEAEKEYGFRQQGVIVIPCEVQHFQRVNDIIERELDHHHHHHMRQHSHNNLQHLAAACFGREG